MRFKLSAFADEADRSLSGQISAMLENGIEQLEIRRVDGQNVVDISLEEIVAFETAKAGGAADDEAALTAFGAACNYFRNTP